MVYCLLLLIMNLCCGAGCSLRFAESNASEDGFIVKAPFSTGGKLCFQKVRTAEEIVTLLVTKAAKYCGQIPYLMVQPHMRNKTECKVVLMHGKVQFLAKICRKARGIENTTFSSPPHKRLFEFAEEACRILGERNPSAVLDGVVRVDIFQTSKGNLVVNEFESLEACTYSTGENEAKLESLKRDYWETIIADSLRNSRSAKEMFYMKDDL